MLTASIALLGKLGLDKASKVLLTGVAHGGTVVNLNADRLSSAIRRLGHSTAQGAAQVVVKALPIDAMHPRLYNSTLCLVPMLKKGCEAAAGKCVEGAASWPNCSLNAGSNRCYTRALSLSRALSPSPLDLHYLTSLSSLSSLSSLFSLSPLSSLASPSAAL